MGNKKLQVEVTQVLVAAMSAIAAILVGYVMNYVKPLGEITGLEFVGEYQLAAGQYEQVTNE